MSYVYVYTCTDIYMHVYAYMYIDSLTNRYVEVFSICLQDRGVDLSLPNRWHRLLPPRL